MRFAICGAYPEYGGRDSYQAGSRCTSTFFEPNFRDQEYDSLDVLTTMVPLTNLLNSRVW